MSSQASASAKLLSIDGGGVRGISSMVILLAIMEKVKELEKNAGIFDDSERLPCRYFDLAGGTSTGGLAAIMLFRLEMSVSQAIEQYQNMAAKIFSNKDQGPYTSDDGSSPVGSFLTLLKGWVTDGPLKEKLFNILYYICIFSGCSHYSGKGLIDAVDEVANVDRRKGEKVLLLDDSKPKTLLFTTIDGYGSKGILRSYTPPKKDSKAPKSCFPPEFWSDIELHKAARATTSAPFYFPPTTFKDYYRCIDGGLLNNNPVERVWDARYELDDGTGNVPHVSLVVSLGTAKTNTKPIEAPRAPENLLDLLMSFLTRPGTIFQIFMSIIDLATNTEEPHRDFEQRIYYRNTVRKGRTEYYRFNAEVDRDRYIDLDDVRGMEGLKKDTEHWLSQRGVRNMVSECAHCLMNK